MTNSVRLITPPDIVFNQSIKMLFVYPGEELKPYIEKYVHSIQEPTDLYFYTSQISDPKWLLTISNIADYLIIDIDHVEKDIEPFLSYLISIPNTYYKCKHMDVDWNLLNQNRFYDFPKIFEENNERK